MSMCRHLGHFIKECVFPDNKPEDIAREVVYAITHEKEEIILPVFSRFFAVIRSVWWDFCCRLSRCFRG